MSDREPATPEPPQRPGRPRVPKGFAAGFGATFIALALLMPMEVMAPSGRFVVRCRLWQYYIVETRNAFGVRGQLLGPQSGALGRLVTTAFEHVVASAIGGAIAVGAEWVYRKTRDNPQTQ